MQILPIPYHPAQDVLDSTKIQAYQDCPRMFFYEYMLGWRSSYPSNHLVFGSCVHKALEHVIIHGYTVESAMEALEIFNTDYRMVFPESTDELFWPKTPARFFDILIKYLKDYKGDKNQYTVYKTEFGGTISLSDTHRVAFKMDTIFQDNYTGLYVSLEHKTTQANAIHQNYIVQHQMGIQCGTYNHVLNCLFPPDQVAGIVINLLCFKKTKGLKAGVENFILQRFPVNLSNAHMYSWLENTKRWMDLIAADREALANTTDRDDLMVCFPKNGRSCTNFNRVCTYFDLCQGWQNPLQHLERMPVDMEVNFWNPLEEELREVLTL